jgi:hypothetical protein
MPKKKTAAEIMLPLEKSPEQEKQEVEVVYRQLQSLTDLAADLQDAQERVSLVARHQDLGHISKIDTMVDIIITALNDVLTDKPELLKAAFEKMIEGGKFDRLKDIMFALDKAYGIRETLLSFDTTRAKKVQQFTYEAVWENEKGDKVGVKVTNG